MPSFLKKNVGRPIAKLFKSPKNFVTGLRKGFNTLRDVAGESAGLVSLVNPEMGAGLMAAKEGFGALGQAADRTSKIGSGGASVPMARPSAADIRTGLKTAIKSSIEKPQKPEPTKFM